MGVIRVALQFSERGAKRRAELRAPAHIGEPGKPFGARVHELAVLPLAHSAQIIAAQLRAFLPHNRGKPLPASTQNRPAGNRDPARA